MLAVQQKPSESQESMFTGLNVTQNIDISLLSSFPVVPTAPVVLDSTQNELLTSQTNSSGATITQIEESSAPPISATLISAPTFESQVTPSAPVSSVSASVTEIRKKAVNFSALYAAEVNKISIRKVELGFDDFLFELFLFIR